MSRILPPRWRKRIHLLCIPLAILLAATTFYRQSVKQDRLNHALFAAIRDDDTQNAVRLLGEGADANARDRGGRSPTLGETLTELWQRLRSGRTVTIHPTPLTKMLAEGNAPDDGEQLVRALLDHGADPNDRDNLGYSALSLALIYHREDIARLLLERGANVNSASSNGDTPLMLDFGDPEMPQFLLQRRADPNAVNSDGKTPLIFACEQGDIEKARLLLQHGAQINVPGHHGTSPLHIAAGKGNLPLVRLLLAAHANPNSLDHFGMSPLDIATLRTTTRQPSFSDMTAVKLLIAHGAHQKSLADTRLILARRRRASSH